jgi:predicted nucleic-acid-binding Zn-ribbon protein
MGAENAKMKSAEKSAETGGHHSNYFNVQWKKYFQYARLQFSNVRNKTEMHESKNERKS